MPQSVAVPAPAGGLAGRTSGAPSAWARPLRPTWLPPTSGPCWPPGLTPVKAAAGAASSRSPRGPRPRRAAAGPQRPPCCCGGLGWLVSGHGIRSSDGGSRRQRRGGYGCWSPGRSGQCGRLRRQALRRRRRVPRGPSLHAPARRHGADPTREPLDDAPDLLGLEPFSGASADGAMSTGVRGAVQRERLRRLRPPRPGAFAAAGHVNTPQRMGMGLPDGGGVPGPRLCLGRFGGVRPSAELGVARVTGCGRPSLRLARELRGRLRPPAAVVGGDRPGQHGQRLLRPGPAADPRG